MGGPICTADVGSTRIKVAVYDDTLRQISRAEALFPARREGTHVEASPEEVWRVLAETLAKATHHIPAPPSMLALTTQMAGLILLDDKGEAIMPFIPGIDRSIGHAGSNSHADAYYRTGCPPAGLYPVDRLAALNATSPTVQRAARIGGLKEYLLFKLTGEWVTDPASASTTGLYDQLLRDWWPPALALAGLSGSQLPSVWAMTDIAGTLLAEAATLCGLPAALPVLVGTGDGPAANLAAGAIAPEQLCLTVGTTLVLRHFTPTPGVPDPTMSVFRQGVDEATFCKGCRFEPALGGSGAYVHPGVSRSLDTGDLPTIVRGLLDLSSVAEIRVTGGIADEESLMQAVADAWQKPVHLTNALDGTRGVALLALAAMTGRRYSHLVDRFVRIGRTLNPH